MPKKLKKLLLVDDSPLMHEISAKILKSGGYEVCSAWDGEGCLKMVKTENPDAILMDVILPDGDGKEFARNLKLDPASCHIPIIFTTNTVKLIDDRGNETINIDGNLYRAFAKPLHHPKLLSVIRKEINRSRTGGTLPKTIV